MIESEYRRQRIAEIITRWAQHTKVASYLREHDIPLLVDQIVGEFYRVHLLCGHLVHDRSEGIVLTYKDFDREGIECEVSGIYCQDCAEWYKKKLGAKEDKP